MKDYIFKFLILGDSNKDNSEFINDFLNENLINELNNKVEFKEINSNSSNISIQIAELNHDKINYKDLKGIIFVYDIHKIEEFKDFNSWIIELTKICSKKLFKIVLGIKSEIEALFYSLEKKNFRYYQIELFKISEKEGYDNNKIIFSIVQNIINNSKEIRYNIFEDNIISNISSDINLNIKDEKEENKEKIFEEYKRDINYIINNLDEDLYEKITTKNDELLDNYSFYFNNKFEEKIFALFDMLKKYDSDNFIKIFELMQFLKEEKQNLQNLVENFPLITYNNKKAYLASYYLYMINKLLNFYNLYRNNTYSEEEIIKQSEENLKNEKIKIINELNNICKANEELINQRINEVDNEIENKITHKIIIANNLEFKLKEIRRRYKTISQIIKNLNDYYSIFFRQYLCELRKLINNIPNTINYFKEKILNDNSEKIGEIKLNLEEFDYFIFYVFNFDYIKNIDIMKQIYHSFEDSFNDNSKNFEDFEIMEYKFKIENNMLLQTDPNKNLTKLKNYQNYCFELIKTQKLKRNRYLNENLLLFFKYQKNNIFEKYRHIYKSFFKNIFQMNSIKTLFIDIFPYLKEDYFINDKFIDDIFEKIKAFNFIPIELLAETISPILNIYIKGYFEGKDDLNSEICSSSAYIILIFHELAHYIRIYIYKKTKNEEYKKSIDLCEENEIGVHLEVLLFGDSVKCINFNQALFLLNIDNYKQTYNTFCENFKNLGIKDFKNYEDLDKAKIFLKNIGLEVNKIEINKPPTVFQIKGEGSNLMLGLNRDKTGRSVDLKEIFEGTGFECLLNENN